MASETSETSAQIVCEGGMSRWAGTSMASYRAVKTGAAPTASARGENGGPAARPSQVAER